MKKNFPEESFVLKIANEIPNVSARYSSSEEDHGAHKSDVVLNYLGKEYHLQVSRQPKSKKQQKTLMQRGTYPIHVMDFYGNQEPGRVRQEIEEILNSEH